MDRQPKEKVAALDDEALKVFVRSGPDALTPAALDLVAGGTGSCIEPNGILPKG